MMLESFDATMFPTFGGGYDCWTPQTRRHGNGEARRRLFAGRRRSRRRGRGFLDRRGVAGLFHRALGNAEIGNLKLWNAAISAPAAARLRQRA